MPTNYCELDILDNVHEYETIQLPEGVFHIKCLLQCSNIILKGAGLDKTFIVFDDYAKKLDENYFLYNTFRSWTMAVCGDNVAMEDLTILNEAGQPETKGQQIALTVYGDNFKMRNCRISSTQDTLFLGPLPDDLIKRYDGFLPNHLRAKKQCRQSFENCLIEGTIDFIFGSGEATFDHCELRSLKDVRNTGFVAAPSHGLAQEQGFVFRNCVFTAEEGVEDGSIYLARPWRDHGMCEFIDCIYGSHISPLGFDHWSGTEREKTARFHETPCVQGRVSWVK